MHDASYFGIILAMGLVTYLPRWMPLFVLSQRTMPGWLMEWLDLIPVAILSALVFPEILTSGTPKELDVLQARSLAAVPTLIFALKTRSLGGTVLVGMVLFWALEKL
ncbi:MAG: AzlD domain-containing protein [Syntrophobacteraceae bacterium]|jgi:branched-subunit amino acid transport protein|nr:AzlD domain-containing protein [Syntrophobacteraceae bacterium]